MYKNNSRNDWWKGFKRRNSLKELVSLVPVGFFFVNSVHCAEISPLSQCWERQNGAAFEPLKEQKRN